ncbi:MAG: hypothetical protein RLP09_05715 [Sandaracinaceae bacterium]
MSKGNGFESGLLELVLNNAPLEGIGDAAGLQPSAVAGDLFVSLHTADPGEGGTQATSEATYPGYARAAVPRDGTGWSVAGGQAENGGTVAFPECTGGSQVITHAAIGVDPTGAGAVLYRVALAAPVTVEAGMFPRFPAAALSLTED